MPKIEIFCTPFCPYCVRAKKLLEQKKVEYEDIRVDQEPNRHKEMITRIFIDDDHVGGCDELFALEAEGTLDSRLGL